MGVAGRDDAADTRGSAYSAKISFWN